MTSLTNSQNAQSPSRESSTTSDSRKPIRNGVSKMASQKIAVKPPKSIVSETMIAAWLGSVDFADSNAQTRNPSTPIRSDQSASSMTDDELLTRIANRLAERNIPTFARLGLDLRKGVVTVRGNVTSKGERLLLLHILRTTPGVQKVNDGLTIVPTRIGRAHSEHRLDSILSAASTIVTNVVSGFRPIHGAGTLAALGLLVSAVIWTQSQPQPVAVYPARGRVVMDGVPLPEATVLLHAVGASKLPSGIQPRGKAAADGGFAVETFASADGAPEGEFIATVHLMKSVVVDGDPIPGPNILPVVYSRLETSPFRVKISCESNEIAILELHQPRHQ